MFRKSFTVLSLALVLTLVLSSFAFAAPPDRTSIVDVALAVNAETGEFSTLIAALVRVEDSGLLALLDSNRQFTVFAPTDAAFDGAAAALGFADGMELVNSVDAELLAAVLAYHVAPGNRDSGDVLGSERVRTLSKGFLFPYVDMDSGEAFIVDTDSVLGVGTPDAKIISPDVFADNGVIHVIDFVLLP